MILHGLLLHVRFRPAASVKAGARLALCVFGLAAGAAGAAADEDLTHWVNPLIGTDTSYELSRGNTFPAITRPWGMTSWAPQTGTYENALFYEYKAGTFTGIRTTHQASVWMGGYGEFSFMAITGDPGFLPQQRASPFAHAEERARPESYSVDLPRYGLRLEVTPTSRAAIIRVQSTLSDTVTFVVDPHPPGTEIQLLPQDRLLLAMTQSQMGSAAANFRSFLAAQFDRAPVDFGTWTDSTSLPGSAHGTGNHSGAWVRFADVRARPLVIRVGTSFMGADFALRSIEQELGSAGFQEIADEGRQEWNRLLGRARITGGSQERRVVYYTALYRSLLFPRNWHEIDDKGAIVHFSPYDGLVHSGPMVADFGLWDAFRSHVPLYFLLYPDRGATVLQGLVNCYLEGGWFPKWLNPGYSWGMPGTQAEILFADGWAKGVRDFDVDAAYEGLLRNATEPGEGGRGRLGLDAYERLGYVPGDLIEGSVSRTLEFAYGDYALGTMARDLGHDQDADRFLARAASWRHVFDASTGFVRGRNSDGSWMALDPYEWGGAFVEGNAWQYTWSVLHDVPGLAAAMGGRSALAARLDSFLQAPSTVRPGSYGRMIHEMREFEQFGIGQYNHGNQPCHHVPYLYNYTDSSWKTAPLVRAIGDDLYQPTPAGYPGDEDTGSLGSWFVFTALGFYPIQPGSLTYALGAPRFPRAQLTFENGNVLIVEAVGIEVPGAVYVQSVRFDGQRLEMPFIGHDRLTGGGTLRFDMGTEPDSNLFSGDKDLGKKRSP
ncbi:MAG: GH92 family glycosyl hydrolase [bacterium]|nr:GH92 family glycosyl hydrolase [bacterium]